MENHKNMTTIVITQTLFSAIILLSSAGPAANAPCLPPFAPRPGPFALEAEPDTVEKKQSSFTGIPILCHSPETKLAVGAAGSYFYRQSGSDTTSRPSTLGASLIYTQKQQIEIGFGVDLYWKKDTHHFSGGIGYSKFPDTFYGIGNNTAEEMAEDHTPQTFELGLSFQKTVRPGLYLGIHYQFSNVKMIEVEENGLLAQGDIPGSEGGVISSAGLGVNLDTRNNIFYPSAGGFYEFSVSLSRSAIGSDFGFAGYGDVADKVSHFERNSFKHYIGWGIRYLLIRDEKLNLRLDFGYGKGSSAFYINISEAFCLLKTTSQHKQDEPEPKRALKQMCSTWHRCRLTAFRHELALACSRCCA